MKKSLLMLMLALSLCFVTVGCGEKEKEAEVEVEETEEVVEETVEYQVIGNESEDAYKVLLTNGIGQDIKGIAIKTSDKEEYPANMMKAEEVLKNGDTAELYYTPETAAEATEAESTEKALNIVYNVQLTLADDSVYELSSFGFDDIKESAELCLEDEVVFVKYISAATDDEVSTKEQEIGAKEQKAAEEAAAQAAEEAAAAQKAAEEAAAQAAAQQAAQSQTSNNNYGGNYSGGGSSSAGSSSGGSTTTAPSQGSESCLGGGVEINQGSEGCLGGGVEINQGSEGCLGGVEVNPQ